MKQLKLRRILLLLLVLSMAGASALAAQVKLSSVSLHDPTILRDTDGTFYVYGSHMQAAKSPDLISFQMFSKLEKCNLQPSYATEFREALSWAQTGTFWAPDVIRLADGRYYMYYCCCEGSSPLSALGQAVSDSPEGPFEHVAILLKSGMTGYDATRYPNVIDPCVFYDKTGARLYMVYGSYSGGIFLLELDPETGLILPGQAKYGTHLLGGNHSCIEAPYIVYNPDTDYHYLFLSFGGLGVNDGYNIRVCRARNVDGPYEDAAGHSMLDCKCKPGNFWNNDDIADYGTKLMGGYWFEPLPGENSSRESRIRSPGHNSVYHDEDSGQWFILHHTRFASSGERYILQVRTLSWNQDGWPLVSPVRYTGNAGDGTAVQMTGTFKVLSHEQDVNLTEHISVPLQFLEDGTITGSMEGKFICSDGRVIITLDGIDYDGVCSVGYDEIQDEFVTVFTAMSAEGRTLWGVRATGQENVQSQ